MLNLVIVTFLKGLVVDGELDKGGRVESVEVYVRTQYLSHFMVVWVRKAAVVLGRNPVYHSYMDFRSIFQDSVLWLLHSIINLETLNNSWSLIKTLGMTADYERRFRTKAPSKGIPRYKEKLTLLENIIS